MRDDEPTNLHRVRRIQSLAEELADVAEDGDAQLVIIGRLLKEAHALSARITRAPPKYGAR